MGTDLDMMRTIESAPLRTVRLQDVEHLAPNPWRSLSNLVQQGALTRLARGVYTVPPDGFDGRRWKPTLEAAALALATARFGNRKAILMGLGAARHWTAIPRAISVTTVAITVAGRPPVTLDTGGTVHLISRDLSHLDAILERTELGAALVTTPAQTLFDLLMRPHQGASPEVAADAARNLIARVPARELQEIVEHSARTSDAVRNVLKELEERDVQVE